ncbi:hypothetical protein FACS1894208_01530 [Clostridia bacterium]|nr:hypothetical protein FACS1894208_01530 [Clostridia bacterium]
MSTVQKISFLVERMTENDQAFLMEMISRMLPDDIATPDDIEAVAVGNSEYLRGDTLSDSEIDWN